MDEPKRVLIVDDSSLVRHRLSTIIRSAPGFEVAGIASTGSECLALLPQLRPHVITLDVHMPDMDGLETLRQIMDRQPTPVLMVSSETDAGAKTTIDALALGAVDYIAKPTTPWIHTADAFREDLVTKLTVVAGVRVRPGRRRTGMLAPLAAEPVLSNPQNDPPRALAQNAGRWEDTPLVAIGSSTGGPQALDQLFSDLRSMQPAAFIVVQHMPPVFTKSLAGRLNRRTEMDVREVDEGDVVRSGTVLVGQGGFHVTLGKDKRYHIDQTPPLHGVRPAVDRLLLSLAENWPGKCLVVIMTGMGVDGTNGARVMHAHGAEVLAQDESTSIVYGMPRSVVEAGIVKAVHPLDKLGQAIEKWIHETADAGTPDLAT